jgi:hypothetical protein
MNQLDPDDRDRCQDLFERLIQEYVGFVSALPQPLPGLAAAHQTYFGATLTRDSEAGPPIPASIRFPFLFWPLFHMLEDDLFLEIAASGAFLYTGSVLLDHLIDGEITEPAGFNLLQRELWDRGISGFRRVFPNASPFWIRFDSLLRMHADALAAELHCQNHPEMMTLAQHKEIAAGKTSPAIITLAALTEETGKNKFFPALALSVRQYGIAMQFVDDLQDWEHDLENGHLTYVLSCIIPKDAWESPETRIFRKTSDLITYSPILLEHWRMGIEAFDHSLASVYDLLCPGWTDQIFLQRTNADALWLRTIASQVAQIFSLEFDSSFRKKSYPDVQPARVSSPAPSPVAHAIEAVLSFQRPSGAWKDFDIQNARASDAWVTAHIGLKLASLPEKWTSEAIDQALDKTTTFLVNQWRHGWGYNANIPVDADSTAHVLLFYEAIGIKPPPSTVPLLLTYQQVDGGFATYNRHRSPNMASSWCVSAPDVTPIVARALKPYSANPEVRGSLKRALARMEPDRLKDNTWPAFWWTLKWYTAQAWAATCQSLGCAFPDLYLPLSSVGLTNLDKALLLELALILDYRELAAELYSSLVRSQSDSGLWPIEPALCQPVPGIFTPWEQENRDVVYLETVGIYSAATILHAIANFETRLIPES